MLLIESSTHKDVYAIAECYMRCFPASLSTRLGKKYLAKSLSWFFSADNRFMIHIAENDRIIGFCGGHAAVKVGDGSSSGMLQYAFNEAVISLLRKPLLLFHQEVRRYYPFIWKNILQKILRRKYSSSGTSTFHPVVGLVVIGVDPNHQGKGLSKLLLKEFEKAAMRFKRNELILSVRKNNAQAINAYKASNWQISKEDKENFIMQKHL